VYGTVGVLRSLEANRPTDRPRYRTIVSLMWLGPPCVGVVVGVSVRFELWLVPVVAAAAMGSLLLVACRERSARVSRIKAIASANGEQPDHLVRGQLAALGRFADAVTLDRVQQILDDGVDDRWLNALATERLAEAIPPRRKARWHRILLGTVAAWLTGALLLGVHTGDLRWVIAVIGLAASWGALRTSMQIRHRLLPEEIAVLAASLPVTESQVMAVCRVALGDERLIAAAHGPDLSLEGRRLLEEARRACEPNPIRSFHTRFLVFPVATLAWSAVFTLAFSLAS